MAGWIAIGRPDGMATIMPAAAGGNKANGGILIGFGTDNGPELRPAAQLAHAVRVR
jgi:hypothetical protein